MKLKPNKPTYTPYEVVVIYTCGVGLGICCAWFGLMLSVILK